MQPKNFLPLQQRTQRHIFTEITILIFKRSNHDKEKYFKTAAGIADVLPGRIVYGM